MRHLPFFIAVIALVTACSPAGGDVDDTGQAADAAAPVAEANSTISLETANAAIASTATNARYHKQALVEMGPRVAMVGEYEYLDGEWGHSTAGRLDVFYLDTADGAVTGVERFENAVEIGSQGRMSAWSVSNEFLDVPVVRASGGFTGQGVTESCTLLVALTPEGPREVAAIPDHFDNEGFVIDAAEAESTDGTITDIVRGQSFAVRYTGSQSATVTYEWDGTRFAPSGEAPLGSCGGE